MKMATTKKAPAKSATRKAATKTAAKSARSEKSPTKKTAVKSADKPKKRRRDEDVMIFQVNDRNQIRAELSEFNGKNYLNVRKWYYSTDDDEFKPGKDGFTVPRDQAEEFLGELADWASRQSF